MSFSEAYGNILSPFLKKFQEAGNQKLVKAVLKDSAEAVTQNKDLLEFKGELPKNLEGVRSVLFSVFLFNLILSILYTGNIALFQKMR